MSEHYCCLFFSGNPAAPGGNVSLPFVQLVVELMNAIGLRNLFWGHVLGHDWKNSIKNLVLMRVVAACSARTAAKKT